MKQTAWSKQPVVLLTKSLLFPVGPLWGRLNKRSLPGADQLRGTGSRGIRAALCEGVALILARRANLSNTRHTNHKKAPLRGLEAANGGGLSISPDLCGSCRRCGEPWRRMRGP